MTWQIVLFCVISFSFSVFLFSLFQVIKQKDKEKNLKKAQSYLRLLREAQPPANAHYYGAEIKRILATLGFTLADLGLVRDELESIVKRSAVSWIEEEAVGLYKELQSVTHRKLQLDRLAVEEGATGGLYDLEISHRLPEKFLNLKLP